MDSGSSVSKDTLTQVNFTTPNNGWLTTIGQVHYTASGGATWNVQHQIRSQSKPPGILDLHFVSKTEGWAVGGKGTVLWTENGGGHWESFLDLSDKHLWGVHFVDPEHGWIVGEEGEVLHTQDGGKRWVRQRSDAEQPLFAVYFTKPNTWMDCRYKRVDSPLNRWRKNVGSTEESSQSEVYEMLRFTMKNGDGQSARKG